MQLLMGLLVGLFGLALVAGGYRYARIFFPIWGFIWGFALGAGMVADATSGSFLGSLFGIISGLVLGIVAAVLIYAYYYAAIVLTGAAIGYWLGSGFILLLGLRPGFISAMAGLALGAVVGIGMVMLNMPKAVLIVLTSIGGAIFAVGGLLLAFHQIPVDIFSFTAARIVIANSFIWTLTAMVLAAIGITAQYNVPSDFELEEWGGRSFAS